MTKEGLMIDNYTTQYRNSFDSLENITSQYTEYEKFGMKFYADAQSYIIKVFRCMIM